MSPLWGVALLVLGFVLRLSPPLVVLTSALVTGALASIAYLPLIELIGASFRNARLLLLIFLALPLIACLEQEGLREWLRQRLRGSARVTLKRVLTSYLAVRQLSSAFGLTSLGGHAQSVRPLLVPLAEVSAENAQGPLKHEANQRLRAFCAATDNVALFFGEDIFLAFGAVLLIQSTLAANGYILEPQHIALWAIPTGILAFVIHALRILRFKP